MIDRRALLASAAAGLVGCAGKVRTAASPPPAPAQQLVPPIAPIRARPDRIFRVTVCLRPFRAAGPRLDVERVGDKTVVHNYGHGGSGWSLSWGSSSIAVEKALAVGERNVGVIGCGALGLTSAILLQRAGAKVTIYAKERPPEVRSARATGTWTPDSRVALADSVSADFPTLWEKMCRRSFHTYESYLGLPGNPVEWMDMYLLPGRGSGVGEAQRFAKYMDRVRDLTPIPEDLPPGSHPFPTPSAMRASSMVFNIAAYSHQLMTDFFVEGGKVERVEFQSPSELQTLPQKVLINATGYGARALWKDESIIPVRGQIAWLIPEPEVHYGVFYNGVFLLGRRDGVVVQSNGANDFNNDDEQPNRQEAEAAVARAAELFARMKAAS